MVLALVVGAFAAAPAVAANTWAGVWNSDFGRLTMDAGGSGNYEGFSPGTVSGGVEGNVNQGTWEQPGTPPKKGTYKFTLSGDGRSFTGDWAYEGGGCGTACGWNGSCIDGPCLDNTAGGVPAKPGPAVGRIAKISGEVSYRIAGGQWRRLRAGESVAANQEIATGLDATITLTFADGTSMTIDEMSQVLMADIATEGSRQTIRISVVLGKLDATINPQKTFQSDFKVTVPIGGGAARGTRFSVFYDAVARAALVSVREGIVGWDPIASGLAAVDVTAGQEIEATATGLSAPAPIGTAGAIGGVNRFKARDLVLARLDRARRGCRLKLPRSATAVSTRAAGAAWRVRVNVSGRVRGGSTWAVSNGKVAATNKVARKINRRCR